ncbi:hypothetical protein RCL06_24300, partial [Salmonella enterica subsp. enterica serovar Typhimurium]
LAGSGVAAGSVGGEAGSVVIVVDAVAAVAGSRAGSAVVAATAAVVCGSVFVSDAFFDADVDVDGVAAVVVLV